VNDFRQEFLAFAVAHDVLRFGDFVTKAGRRTPYFFNAGLFDDGESLRRLGRYYADAFLVAGVECDQLFGPAYKGISLAAATAIALAEKGHNLPFSFNRKEPKDHGEGGSVIGAALKGRVLVVDDVITAGTSVRESVELIRREGGRPAGVLIALDRMERGQGAKSAVQEVRDTYGIPVAAIATLDDLMTFVAGHPALSVYRAAIAAYRTEYGAR
jgi:orotate phosphoribosyltransferase